MFVYVLPQITGIFNRYRDGNSLVHADRYGLSGSCGELDVFNHRHHRGMVVFNRWKNSAAGRAAWMPSL